MSQLCTPVPPVPTYLSLFSTLLYFLYIFYLHLPSNIIRFFYLSLLDIDVIITEKILPLHGQRDRQQKQAAAQAEKPKRIISRFHNSCGLEAMVLSMSFTRSHSRHYIMQLMTTIMSLKTGTILNNSYGILSSTTFTAWVEKG